MGVRHEPTYPTKFMSVNRLDRYLCSEGVCTMSVRHERLSL